jgi:hypothetical protein
MGAFSILVPDVQEGNVLVKSGVLTKDAKNKVKEMAKQGLEPTDNITSSPRETCISLVYINNVYIYIHTRAWALTERHFQSHTPLYDL